MPTGNSKSQGPTNQGQFRISAEQSPVEPESCSDRSASQVVGAQFTLSQRDRAAGRENRSEENPLPPHGQDLPPAALDELTGLPGLRAWRHVYLFVFGCFVLWVLLLLGLTVFYS